MSNRRKAELLEDIDELNIDSQRMKVFCTNGVSQGLWDAFDTEISLAKGYWATGNFNECADSINNADVASCSLLYWIAKKHGTVKLDVHNDKLRPPIQTTGPVKPWVKWFKLVKKNK